MVVEETKTSVVIVGAGPAGLSLAIELGMRGVSCLVIDEKDEDALVLKANATQARTMEHFRRMGFADEIRAQGIPLDYPTDVAYFTRIGTHELARLRLPAPKDVKKLVLNSTGAWSTPELPHRCNQMFIERILRDHAKKNNAIDLRFRCKLLEFEDHGDRVTVIAQEQPDGRQLRISCDYLVGCDGAHSPVRKKLGIEYEGTSEVSRDFLSGPMCVIYFECPDFYDRVSCDPAWMYWTVNETRRGILVAVNGVDSFLLHAQTHKGEPLLDPLPQARAQEIFEEVFGGDCPPIKLLHASYWHAGFSLVAQKYGQGRVLIAGDAAHLFTPSGGLGYNTAVDDVANLGWKLAAVINGYGGPGLIATYSVERWPMGRRNTAIAGGFAESIGGYVPPPHLEEDTAQGDKARAEAGEFLNNHVRREFNIPGVTFGIRYDGSPIILSDAPPPPDSTSDYVPSGVPGGRAPHLWLDGARSLYDCFGREFTLLRLSDAAGTEGWVTAAGEKAIPLDVLDLTGDPCLSQARELYGADLVLVRPDQHIAWRGGAHDEPGLILSQVLGWTTKTEQ